ncbi:MAG: nucleotidyltransferase domain-containing protein [Acidobacteriota bacterium]
MSQVDLHEHLPQTTQLLYSELLELSIHAAAEEAARPLPAGSFVQKKIKNGTYWYLQTSVGGTRHQRYLGPDSDDLRRWMDNVTETRRLRRPDAKQRERLAAMLAQGQATTLGPSLFRVAEVLEDAGVFRLGGVLVGTHAFGSYGNMLGVRWRRASLRTQGSDIEQDPAIGIGLQSDVGASDVPAALDEAAIGFAGIPTLSPRHPSTSFKIRGKKLRVDFLTPLVGAPKTGPVYLPSLKVSAQPLRLLDYLIEGPVQALLLGRKSSLLVNLPDPARFAIHKLWTSGRRGAAFHNKSIKDLDQASALLRFLREERPADIESAWAALEDRPKVRRDVLQGMERASRDLFSTDLVELFRSA